MMSLVSAEVYSQTVNDLSTFSIESKSVYVYGESSESRSSHFTKWQTNATDVHFLRVEATVDSENDNFTKFISIDGSDQKEYFLRSNRSMSGFVGSLPDKRKIYLDITGLPHALWAKLLQVFIQKSLDVLVVYAEPYEYKRSYSENREVYDLSKRILGLNPLPGFFSCQTVNSENVCFIPLLGFEGPRFQYLLEHVDPPGEKIYPVIGVPGFEPEYPFVAYFANARVLDNSKSWPRVRFAPANCPFKILLTSQRL